MKKLIESIASLMEAVGVVLAIYIFAPVYKKFFAGKLES